MASNCTGWHCIQNNDTDFNSFYFYEKEQFAILWILFFLIVVGNAGVLLAMKCGGSKKKSRLNYFITHLATADMCVGVISVLTDVIWKITVVWNAGNIACKAVRFLQALVTFSSTYILVALSMDRYYAIKFPMNFSGSWKRAKLLVLSAWIISGLLALPLGILYHERSVQGRLQCWIEFDEPWQWQLYMTLVSLALFFIPAILILICYVSILATIWANGKAYSKIRICKIRVSPSTVNGKELKRASSRGLIPKAKIKTVKMTFSIVLAFVLCWSPYIFFDLLQVYGFIPKTQNTIALATLIQSLAPLNSAANPIIFCAFRAKERNR